MASRRQRRKRSTAPCGVAPKRTGAGAPAEAAATELDDATRPVAFVVMPFTSIGDLVFSIVIEPAGAAAGYQVVRADTVLNQRAVMEDIVRGIQQADLVICDMTGKNANVFYELGLAHAMHKPTVLLAQSTTDMPFDLKAYRTVIYEVSFTPDGQFTSSLSSELQPLLEEAHAGRIVFSSPVDDFGEDVPTAVPEAPTEGILDMMQRFITEDVPTALEAMEELNGVTERATESMTASAGDTTPGEGGDLAAALLLAARMAKAWDQASDELEPLVDHRLIPSVVAIERDVTGVIRAAASNPDADIGGFLSGVEGLGEQATTFVETISETAAIVRRNATWATSLMAPGERLAAIYDRIAANYGRIVSMAETASTTLRDRVPPDDV